MEINKTTLNFLRPVVLNKLYSLDNGVPISDETTKRRDLERTSYNKFMGTLTKSQHESYLEYENVSVSAWASEGEDYFLQGFISGVQTSIGLNPSIILKLLQLDKGVQL